MAPKIDLPDNVLRDKAVEIPKQIFIPFFQPSDWSRPAGQARLGKDVKTWGKAKPGRQARHQASGASW